MTETINNLPPLYEATVSTPGFNTNTLPPWPTLDFRLWDEVQRRGELEAPREVEISFLVCGRAHCRVQLIDTPGNVFTAAEPPVSGPSTGGAGWAHPEGILIHAAVFVPHVLNSPT
jgi:hypothetical protein